MSETKAKNMWNLLHVDFEEMERNETKLNWKLLLDVERVCGLAAIFN